MEIIYTKDSEWLRKWDAFILAEDKASHLMLSTWNASFASYGFDYEICIAHEDGKIYGGFAAVIAKVVLYDFYIVPYGPIMTQSKIAHLNDLISKVPERAKHYKCCYCQISLPVSDVPNGHAYNDLPVLPVLGGAKSGHRFKHVYSSNGLNWVDVRKAQNEEELLEGFKSSVRRSIRSSLRKDLEARLLETEEDIRLGYELCLENARLNHYSLREWSSFRETLLAMIAGKSAKFIAVYKDGNLKGASLIITGGNYDTYILGGTKKEKPDLLVGHFIHWEGIRLAFHNNLSGYNISLGGPKSVVDFKSSFTDAQILFTDSKYHWVLKPAHFGWYQFFEKHLKPHKKILLKVLSLIRRK